MKILYISEFPHTMTGGISRHINAIASNLTQMGHTVEYMNAYNFKGITIYEKQVISSKEIYKKIKSINADVIHIHGFSSIFVAKVIKISAKLQHKIVYTPHYHPFEYHRRPFLAKLFFYIFLKRNIKAVGNLVVLTEGEKKFFERFVDKNIIKIIPNGINISRSNFIKDKPKYPRVLFVGRDDKNKRLDFVEEFYDFFEKNDIKCDIVTNLKKTSNSVFTYYQHVSDVKLEKLYQDATLLIVPSMYEAFSFVALEALSYGTPILISDRVQIKNYLYDIKCNKIFSYDNKEDCQNKIHKILNMNEAEYRICVKQNVEFSKNFDWQNISKLLLGLYR